MPHEVAITIRLFAGLGRIKIIASGAVSTPRVCETRETINEVSAMRGSCASMILNQTFCELIFGTWSVWEPDAASPAQSCVQPLPLLAEYSIRTVITPA